MGDTQSPDREVGDHDPEGGFISAFDRRASAADLVVEATFNAPWDPTGNAWITGFLLPLKHDGFHAVLMHRSGAWRHYLRSGETGQPELVEEASSPNISTGTGAQNHLRVVVVGDTGWLFINGAYEAKLDLSGLVDSGSVALTCAFYRGDEIRDGSISFSGFAVRPLRKIYGPRSGAIEHDPDNGRIDVQPTFISMADGVVEATFHNPYPASEGDWSSGFLVRRRGGDFYALGIDESGKWFHRLRSGAGLEELLAEHDSADLISTGPDESNHLRFIALGGDGWLFLNDTYVEMLDLSGWTSAGSVDAVGAYFRNHGVAGKSTKFEDFTVWSADSTR